MKISLKQGTEARKRGIKLQKKPKYGLFKTKIQENNTNKNNDMISISVWFVTNGGRPSLPRLTETTWNK